MNDQNRPFTLDDLAQLIAGRAAGSADKSYTKKLLDAGTTKVAKKFGEEAVELVIAAAEGNGRDITCESADVLYHLLVLLQAAGIPLAEVMDELARRTAQSGLEEKASRSQP